MILNTKKIFLFGVLLMFLSFQNLFAQQHEVSFNESVELGKVHWYRNYDEAIARAKKEKKDIVILFQEVPGCSTCRNYGHHVLSHPLMVEILENNFIPLAIFNNKGGKDKAILKKFNEPTWNNPVVRIIDINGKNLVPRINNDYSALTLSQRLKETLSLRKQPVPEFLNLLELELASKHSNKVAERFYKMSCFWTGEKQLGKLEGVLDTESGFIGHSEVVKMKYDSNLVSKAVIDNYAKNQNFKAIDSKKNYSIAKKDVHYFLKHSKYKYLPLTSLQQIKINNALGSNQSAEKYLSPKQLEWLNSKETKKQNSLLYELEFKTAWNILANK